MPSEPSFEENQTLQEHNQLRLLFINALSMHNKSDVELKLDDILLIKKYLNPTYERLANKYDIVNKKITLGDLRAILIGEGANCLPSDTHFIQIFSKLIFEKDNISELEFLEQYINYLKPLLSHFTKEFKNYNKIFQEEFKTVNILLKRKLIAWQEHEKLERQFGADEYWAHRLAGKAIAPGALIPLLEQDGSTKLYRYHPIMGNTYDKGIVAGAFVPYEVKSFESIVTPPDIKIYFQGTHNLASLVINTESEGAGSKTYARKEQFILEQMSELINNFSHECNNTQISLSIGGHSLGGALAQLCTVSVLKAIALQEYEKNPKEFLSNLAENTKKPTKKLTHVNRGLEKMLAKHHHKKDELIKTFSPFALVKKVNLITQNAAGISEVVTTTGDSLGVHLVKNKKINLERRSLKVHGDVIQVTGRKELFERIPKEHVTYTVVKVDSGYKGIKNKIKHLIKSKKLFWIESHSRLQFHDSKIKPEYSVAQNNLSMKSKSIRWLVKIFTYGLPLLPVIHLIKIFLMKHKSSRDKSLPVLVKKSASDNNNLPPPLQSKIDEKPNHLLIQGLKKDSVQSNSDSLQSNDELVKSVKKGFKASSAKSKNND